MACAAVKGQAIRDSLAASFVHQYFDLKLYAELGLVQSLDDLTSYEIEAMRCVSIGINRAHKEAAKKGRR